MMEMPSPCENCGDVVEYDSLKVCQYCQRWCCPDCMETHRTCENCIHKTIQRTEDEDLRGWGR